MRTFTRGARQLVVQEAALAAVPHGLVDLAQIRLVGAHASVKVPGQAGEDHHEGQDEEKQSLLFSEEDLYRVQWN